MDKTVKYYRGPERRLIERRHKINDRRIDIRFELDKEPRRTKKGRRTEDQAWKDVKRP